MSVDTILTKRSTLIAAVAAAMLAANTAGNEATEAKGSVSEALRNYADVTHDEGDDAEDSRVALTSMLNAKGIKGGTVKASGNHFAGFRAMLAAGLNINTGKEGKPFTAADAQAYIASDDVKAEKAIRKAISEAIGKAAKVGENESRADSRARLLTIAEAIGADLTAYNAEFATAEQTPKQAREA